MTEQELIKRCCKKDPLAQQALYEHYASKMLGVCIRYVGQRDVAEDLLHDGFITIFAKIETFRSEGSLEGWIRRVIVNTVLAYLRKHPAGSTTEVEPLLQNSPSDEMSALDRISERELLHLISALPEGYRTVLNLFAVEGYSHREIANMLHISEGTSRSQYLRAKRLLNRFIVSSETPISHDGQKTKP
ncbi:MAG: sigma-70 family RNA polymerase sigma factor [Alistipes sp.]|nr:sigma-70 family RNA polymerase sigma factor [Alistipes sp.]